MKLCVNCDEPFQALDWCCPHCGSTPRARGGYFMVSGSRNNRGFHSNFLEQLARAERDNFWFRGRNRLLVWALRKYFPGASSFLEVGCGTGFVLGELSRRFPVMRLSGTDVFATALMTARKRAPDADLMLMDARRIPYECEFDVVSAFDVLVHIDEDEIVLSELFRAVKPGGGLILTVPQHPFLWSAADEYATHKRRYRRTELVERVTRAGFEVTRVTSFVSFLLPVMLLSRLRQRRSRQDFGPMHEFRIGTVLNASLSRVMALESWLIARGISFPAGGSLLIIARRAGKG